MQVIENSQSKIDYTQPLYLYDDRSKYDYFLKVSKIIFQDDETMLCKTVMIGSSEYDGQVEEESIMIDKASGEVRNSNFDSWLVTSDQGWVDEELESFIDRVEEEQD